MNFEKGEHKSEEVLKWNPRGQMPTFIYNNHAINESFAACDFIERMHGSEGTKLTPDDPVQLGLMLQRKHEVPNLELKGTTVIHYLYNRDPADIDQEHMKKISTEFFNELKFWDKYLSSSNYLVGDNLSLADLTLFPNIAIYVRFGLDLLKHAPNIARYYNQMLELPSVKKTWPPHWSEKPPPFKCFQ
jgi:glutathione S-transferase